MSARALPLPKCDPVILTSEDAEITFLIVADTGLAHGETRETSEAMAAWVAATKRPPAAVFLGGDNFYPNGVDGVDDDRFQRVWSSVFLDGSDPGRQGLRECPWFVVLGNHDFGDDHGNGGDIEAQMAFTDHPRNPNGAWRMPHRSYQVDFVLPGSGSCVASLFALDSNGVQRSVNARTGQAAQRATSEAVASLGASLAIADGRAPWRLALGHHPMYTHGRLHCVPAACLRDAEYTDKQGQRKPGIGLEKVLSDGGVSAMFTGHEHVFQHKFAAGCHNFVCGASGGNPSGYYGGPGGDEMDWTDKGPKFRHGFAEAVISADRATMTVTFIAARGRHLDGEQQPFKALKTITIPRT